MTPLRQRMIEDMRVRNLSPHTIEYYVRQVALFARYFNRSPETARARRNTGYQLHLVEERKLGWGSFNQAVCALRFLYLKTLGKDWHIESIPFAKQPKKLPLVLSQDQVRSLLEAITNPQHRVIAMTLYAARTAGFRGCLPEGHRHRQPADAAACRSRQGPQGSFGDVVAAPAAPLAPPLPTLSAALLAVSQQDLSPTATSPGTRWPTPSPRCATSSPASPYPRIPCATVSPPICWNPAPICAPSRRCSDTPSIRSTVIYTHVTRKRITAIESPLESLPPLR